MGQEIARLNVKMGSQYLDILNGAPERWHRFVDPEKVHRPEDVLGMLIPYMYSGTYAEVIDPQEVISEVLERMRLDEGRDVEDHGFRCDPEDDDPEFSATNDELVTEWRMEIIRRQKEGSEGAEPSEGTGHGKGGS
ncbi:hypothetical protein ABT282_07315 [Streptomyces sp. NPDC000927]|uniref:hypothetical protein n=1 Tax=Streptomyces sp. NPDC000927 TaxID=3154371 RepID=UPI00332B6B80